MDCSAYIPSTSMARSSSAAIFSNSILEISFLDRHLGLARLRGSPCSTSGPGMAALRTASRPPSPGRRKILCTDAVPESTFLCEYYLDFRGVADRTEVVPLDEIGTRLPTDRIDVATNIHSFSECPLSAVEWWLDAIVGARVRYLMVAMECAGRLLTTEPNGAHIDLMPAIRSRGFRPVAVESKYEGAPSLQRLGIARDTYMFLFERVP